MGHFGSCRVVLGFHFGAFGSVRVVLGIHFGAFGLVRVILGRFGGSSRGIWVSPGHLGSFTVLEEELHLVGESVFFQKRLVALDSSVLCGLHRILHLPVHVQTLRLKRLCDDGQDAPART